MSTPTPAQPGAAPKPMGPERLALLRRSSEIAPGEGRVWCLVRELLADREHHAAEAERRKDAEQVWAATVERQSKELAETCDKVDALTAELERLVSDLNRRGAECDRHACAHADAGLAVDVGRCIGEKDAYVRAAGLLASALRVSPRAGEGADVEITERMTEAELRAEALAEGRDFDADVEHTRQVMLDAVADFERGEP